MRGILEDCGEWTLCDCVLEVSGARLRRHPGGWVVVHKSALALSILMLVALGLIMGFALGVAVTVS